MIDTHLHILPGVDDGPGTVQESLALARVLVQEGVRAAVATPHYNDEFPQRSAAEIQGRVNDLQRELDRNAIPLRLFAGHEVLIKPGLVEDICLGRIATLNYSRYLLLELWNSSWLPETERVVFELRAQGLVPIIAHPERYRAIQQDSDKLLTLLRMGALSQLTASSLLGKQGNTARHCAETLLKKGLISCIASDAHSLRTRQPFITESLPCVEKSLGREAVHFMTEIRPTAIIKNEASSSFFTKNTKNHAVRG